MKLFRKAKHIAPSAPSDIETIHEKLAAVEAEIGEAEAKLRHASLAAALHDDNTAADHAAAEVRALSDRRLILQAALEGAAQAAQAAREALNQREWQARKNALAQHAGRLNRDAKDVTTAVGALHDALTRMTASGGAITALLPPHMRTIAEPWDSFLGANELLRMTLVEGYRQSRDAGSPLFPRPGAARAVERDDGSLPTLSERIAALTTQVRARFDQAAPFVPSDKPTADRADKPQAVSADKPQTPLPVHSATPASSAPVIVDVFPSAPTVAGSDTPAPQFRGVQVDLRSNAGERFTDLTEPFVWPVGEPETEEASTPELENAGLPPGC